MTREELENLKNQYKERIKNSKSDVSWLEQCIESVNEELKKLEVKLYEPMYFDKTLCSKFFYKAIDQHNAGEELKKLISEENAKQGWKVDWKDIYQDKCYIGGYQHNVNEIEIYRAVTFQVSENELYFSEQSSQDQDFLDKIKPLWLKSKGVE